MKNLLLKKVKLVLETVCTAAEPLSLNHLSEILQIPLPTISRITADLIEMRLLEKIDYHRVAPALGVIRLGEAAKERTALLQQAIPQVTDFADKYAMSILISTISAEQLYSLYFTGRGTCDSSFIWSCGAAVVLFAISGSPLQNMSRRYDALFPQATVAEKLIIEREFESTEQEKYLFKLNTMRMWSLTLPLAYREDMCAVTFYGSAPQKISPERFTFEAAKVIARIKSSLGDI